MAVICRPLQYLHLSGFGISSGVVSFCQIPHLAQTSLCWVLAKRFLTRSKILLSIFTGDGKLLVVLSKIGSARDENLLVSTHTMGISLFFIFVRIDSVFTRSNLPWNNSLSASLTIGPVSYTHLTLPTKA